jgi:hypothetical protein
MFKVLHGSNLRHENNVPRVIPWETVEQWRATAERNHAQTLERLDERGGLSPAELWCAAHGLGLRVIGLDRTIDDVRALHWLRQVANRTEHTP